MNFDASHLNANLLHEYLDRALSNDDLRQVSEHLQACEICAARLEELQSLFADLAALPELDLSRDLTPGVLAALGTPDASSYRDQSKPAAWPGRIFVIQAIIAVGLAILAGPFIYQNLGVFTLQSLPFLSIDIKSIGIDWSALTDTLAAWPAAILAGWRGLITSYHSLLPGLSPSVPFLALPASLAVLAFLWLLSNSLLLRQSNLPKNRRSV
jgi:predicted anti-sigma-YlaC factor YlaD